LESADETDKVASDDKSETDVVEEELPPIEKPRYNRSIGRHIREPVAIPHRTIRGKVVPIRRVIRTHNRPFSRESQRRAAREYAASRSRSPRTLAKLDTASEKKRYVKNESAKSAKKMMNDFVIDDAPE